MRNGKANENLGEKNKELRLSGWNFLMINLYSRRVENSGGRVMKGQLRDLVF